MRWLLPAAGVLTAGAVAGMFAIPAEPTHQVAAGLDPAADLAPLHKPPAAVTTVPRVLPAPRPRPRPRPRPVARPVARSRPPARPAATLSPRPAIRSTPGGGGWSWPWSCIAFYESGGNPAADTGNGYSGGLQFSPSTWRAYGGTGNPADASIGQQEAIAERVLAGQGWAAWPNTSRRCGL